MASNWSLEQIINTIKLDDKSHYYKNDTSNIIILNSNSIMSDKSDTTIEKQIKQKSKNRCNYDICKTKLGLVPFECRCLMNFCTEHRLPENHHCSFDYKTFGKSLIEKNNQKVIGEKIQKI